MKTIEILIKDGELLENGTIRNNEGNNKVLVSLHNSGIPNETLISSRDAEFEDGANYNFDDAFREEPHLSTLFRAKAYNKVYLEVEVTTIVNPTKAAKVLFKLLKGVSESAIDMIPGGDIVTAAAKIGAEALFKTIKPEDDVQIIGYGKAEIDVDDIKPEITLALKVPKDVRMTKTTYKPRLGQQKGRGVRKFETETLAKDTPNGTITLIVKEVN